MSPFQKTVNIFQAPAVEGDFASQNPRAVVLAGGKGLITGAPVLVGRFAWVAADNQTVTNYGENGNAPDGFVHREQQGLITAFLGPASLAVPAGFPITLYRQGDFWAKNNGPSALTRGAIVYASYADGGIYSAAPSGASVTGSLGSTNTATLGSTFTATASGTALTTTSVTGKIFPGDVISGTGIPAGTTIVSQTSGTTNGAGVYVTSVATTASAATVTSYGATLNVTATTGLISIGETLSGGAGFPVAATVLAQVSGTAGGAGIYTLSAPGSAYVASATGVTTWSNVINVSAVGSGTLVVGAPISGTGIPSGANIASQTSGAVGGVGVYTLTVPATAYAASTTLTTVGGIATNYAAYPTDTTEGAVGTLVKISTWGL